MARQRHTKIIIVLDRSGSMQTIHEATVKAVNGFMDNLNKVPGEGDWTIVQFDDHDHAAGAGEAFPQVIHDCVNYKHLPRLERQDFKPRGGTALIDALYMIVSRAKESYLSLLEPDRPRVLVVIMTDGEENSSKLHTDDQLRQLTGEVQGKYGWEFIYLGANQDAFAVATNYGLQGKNFEYTSNAIGAAAVLVSGAACARGWKAEGNQSAQQLMSSSQPDEGDQ